MKRTPIRINLELPKLTAEQAYALWNFLDDLSSDLWDVYEDELVEHCDAPLRKSEIAAEDHEEGEAPWSRDDITGCGDPDCDPDF